MKEHKHSRPVDLDKLIARGTVFDHRDEHEEDLTRIKRWLALADRMLESDVLDRSTGQ